MSSTGPVSPYSLPPDLLPCADLPGPLPDGLVQTWRDVHALLTQREWASCQLPDLCSIAVYHYCVYKSFGQESEAALARALFERLTTALAEPLLTDWPLRYLDQLGMVAWLNARFAQDPALRPGRTMAGLAALDQYLLREALALGGQADAASRRAFFRVLRYFSLRLPDSGAEASLRELLDQHADLVPAVGPTELGLADGLAGELLLLMRIYQAGIQGPAIRQSVRAGVRRILAVRREVDFEASRFSIFPQQLDFHSGEAAFSAELSWRRGDLSQSLLLYGAHELLQDAELARIAELVGLSTLLRTTSGATGVVSASFYQGAAGVASLYRKLYRLGGHAAYHKGYRYWLEQTQDRLRQELTTTGYRPQPNDLLHGLTGVGLVLLSALAEPELDWDLTLL